MKDLLGDPKAQLPQSAIRYQVGRARIYTVATDALTTPADKSIKRPRPGAPHRTHMRNRFSHISAILLQSKRRDTL